MTGLPRRAESPVTEIAGHRACLLACFNRVIRTAQKARADPTDCGTAGICLHRRKSAEFSRIENVRREKLTDLSVSRPPTQPARNSLMPLPATPHDTLFRLPVSDPERAAASPIACRPKSPNASTSADRRNIPRTPLSTARKERTDGRDFPDQK